MHRIYHIICISQGPIAERETILSEKGLHTENSVLQNHWKESRNRPQAESLGLTFRTALQKQHAKRAAPSAISGSWGNLEAAMPDVSPGYSHLCCLGSGSLHQAYCLQSHHAIPVSSTSEKQVSCVTSWLPLNLCSDSESHWVDLIGRTQITPDILVVGPLGKKVLGFQPL